jgi:hypothetical protein
MTQAFCFHRQHYQPISLFAEEGSSRGQDIRVDLIHGKSKFWFRWNLIGQNLISLNGYRVDSIRTRSRRKVTKSGVGTNLGY